MGYYCVNHLSWYLTHTGWFTLEVEGDRRNISFRILPHARSCRPINNESENHKALTTENVYILWVSFLFFLRNLTLKIMSQKLIKKCLHLKNKINSAPIQSCDPKQRIMGSGVMRASAPHFSPISIKKYSINKRTGVRRGAGSVHHVEQLRVGSVQRAERQENKLSGPHEQTPSYKHFLLFLQTYSGVSGKYIYIYI